MASEAKRRFPRVLGVLLDGAPDNGHDALRGIVDATRGHHDVTLELMSRERLMGCRDRLAAVVALSPDKPLAQAMHRRRVPVVAILGQLPAHLACTVTIDDERVGALGAEHLLDQGLTRLVFLHAPFAFSEARARGFVRVAKPALPREHARSLVARPAYSYRRPLYVRTIERWLAEQSKPLGVMCWNDGTAANVIECCHALKLRVPDDVAVLGVDNDIRFHEVRGVGLSTVDVGYARLGREAAALALRIAAGQPRPGKPVLVAPEGVVKRASTDAVHVDDALVMRALRWVRDRSCAGVSPRDVIEAMGVSRSGLNMRFRAALGRSLGEEIRAVRLREATRMLVETDTPLTDVALSCGYTDLPHFCNAFRKATRQTPQAFRLAAARQGAGTPPASPRRVHGPARR